MLAIIFGFKKTSIYKMKIIIDVQNMLYSIPKYRNLAHSSHEKALQKLIHDLSQYQDWSGTQLILVIDGQKREDFLMLQKNTEIVFSGHLRSADSVIESLVIKKSEKDRIMVVTSDRGVKDVVLGMGAHFIPPERFERSMRSEIAEKKPNKLKF